MRRLYREDPEYYDGRASGLLASAEDGTPGAVSAFARHDAPLTLDGARLVVAREHGSSSWADLLRYVGVRGGRVARLRIAECGVPAARSLATCVRYTGHKSPPTRGGGPPEALAAPIVAHRGNRASR